MEHSLKAYLERQSSEVLAGMLGNLLRSNKWRREEDTIRLVLEILESREGQIPRELLALWEHFQTQSLQ